MIIRAGALGDTLMLMPAIIQLRTKAEIVLAGRYPGIDYLRPYVDDCIDYEGSGWHRLFMEGPDKDQGLSIPKVDLVTAFLVDPEGRVMDNLKVCLPDRSIHILPPFPPEEEKVHIALYMAQSLQVAGLPVDADKSMKEACKHPLFKRDNSPMEKCGIVLHPGSGSMKKNYPPDLWLELIRSLKGIHSYRLNKTILLLGPAEEGLQSFFREALDKRDAELIFCPEKDELLSLLSQASLYIGHDSGITHLAAMAGTPVIALFKGSSIHQWSPLGPAVKVIGGERGGSTLIGKIIRLFLQLYA